MAFWLTTAGSGDGNGMTSSPLAAVAAGFLAAVEVAFFLAVGLWDLVLGAGSAGMTGGSAARTREPKPANSVRTSNIRCFIVIAAQVEILSRVLSTSAIYQAAILPA